MSSFNSQLETIHGTINSNLQTIKSLLAQARTLTNVAARIDDNEKEVRDEMLDEIGKMTNAISDLIAQNDKLYNAYEKVHQIASNG